MDPSCIEVNLNKVRCYCENDKCTVSPTFTTSLKCFVTNEDFGQGGGNMENFIGVALTRQVNEEMKTLFNCKTSVIGLLSEWIVEDASR